MKPAIRLLAFIFLILGTSAFAQAPSPQEQFQTAVATFQKGATEDSAKKLAELAKQLDPPPVVPEDAEFHALKGAAFVKQAGDAAAFAKAGKEFQAAIATAPWVGEYHYNLAVCEKSAGHFAAAQSAVKFAQIFARDDKERHDCLAFRADLEAAQDLAATKQAELDKITAAKQAAEAQKLQRQKWAQELAQWLSENYGRSPIRTIYFFHGGNDAQAYGPSGGGRSANWEYHQAMVPDRSKDGFHLIRDWAPLGLRLTFRAEGGKILIAGLKNNMTPPDISGEVNGPRLEDVKWTLAEGSGYVLGSAASVQFTKWQSGKPVVRFRFEANGWGTLYFDFEF